MNKQHVNDEDNDIRELIKIFWHGKWVVFFVTLLFSLIAVIYSINQPDIYRSEALLAPVEQDNSFGLGGLQSQLGGLASLAGVNLGGSSASGNTQLAIEILKSRHFTSKFIQKYDILPELMASSVWNSDSNTIIYNNNYYNETDKAWIRDVAPPHSAVPSMQEAYKEFSKRVVIAMDEKTGMVKLSVEHLSPFIAKQWTDWLILDINQTMKTRDVAEAEESTAFLTMQLEQTKIADIRSVLFKLVEEQAKTIMFANVRDEYVFKTIDPALVPEEKSGPKRALICVMAFLLGGTLGVMIVILRYLMNKNKK